jgi:hypothetical protein
VASSAPAETPEGHNVGFGEKYVDWSAQTTDTGATRMFYLAPIDVDPIAQIPERRQFALLNYVVLGSTMRGSELVEFATQEKRPKAFSIHNVDHPGTS